MKSFVLIGVAALFSSPILGGTIFGGLEDWNGLDYDYNDVVFSLSGNALSLHSSATSFAEPALGTSGTPFWNHASLDGPKDNIGYCIYGGGMCNGGTALAPGFQYLAANQTSTGSANDVTFSATGQVQIFVASQNTAGKDRLGWYALSDPRSINWLNTWGTAGAFSFNPGGAFGLVGQSGGGTGGYTYFSQTDFGTADKVSHFAFFTDPPSTVTPEPGIGTLVLFGLLTVAIAVLPRKVRGATE